MTKLDHDRTLVIGGLTRILSLVSSTKEGYITKERVTKKEVLVSHKEGISNQKPKYKLLHIASQIDFPKVNW